MNKNLRLLLNTKLYLFEFLKYVRPIWYNNLLTPFSINWIDIDSLSEVDLQLLEEGTAYQTEQARMMDLTYQAWMKGMIPGIDGKPLRAESITDVADNYIFLARYFNPVWRYYVFVLRIISFHNPWREFIDLNRAGKVQRISPDKKIKKREPFDLDIEKTPLVSVIIPTLNRYEFLKDALSDLEKQTYSNFEVIVVDQSEPFNQEYYTRYNLDLKVQYQEEKALWKARNTGVKSAAADWVLFTEDDVRFDKDWIANHIMAVQHFGAKISSGVFYPEGTKPQVMEKHYKLSDQLATGNVLLHKEVFEKVGLFDRQFEKQRMGDGEFGLRAYLNGYMIIRNPIAFCIDLKAETGGLRQMGSWDAFRPKNFWAPRPVPSVLYYFRKYYGNRAALMSSLISTLPSLISYKFKRNKKMMLFGALLGLFFLPVLLIEFIWSWRLASIKLYEGERIEFLPNKI